MYSSRAGLIAAGIDEDVVRRASSPKFGLSTSTAVSYEDYHRMSCLMGDCDPTYEMLRYVCDRFELNMEQRYWLAFLFATCYCGPTVYYVYNEFPDAENVHLGRLRKWWADNRSKLYFQTDRRWVRSRNQWCDVVQHYLQRVAREGGQAAYFDRFRSKRPGASYRGLYEDMGNLYQFGRYSLFLYLEAVHVVTGFPMMPDDLPFDDETAASSRSGWAFAIGRPDLATHITKKKLRKVEVRYLQQTFDERIKMSRDPVDTVWSLETTLCAYRKYRMGKRYLGYYLDRQAGEIQKLQRSVREGVAWRVLWDYRRETYSGDWLREAA